MCLFVGISYGHTIQTYWILHLKWYSWIVFIYNFSRAKGMWKEWLPRVIDSEIWNAAWIISRVGRMCSVLWDASFSLICVHGILSTWFVDSAQTILGHCKIGVSSCGTICILKCGIGDAYEDSYVYSHQQNYERQKNGQISDRFTKQNSVSVTR